MGHIFRINKVDGHTSTTIVDWSSTTRSTYDHGFVDKIQDTTVMTSMIMADIIFSAMLKLKAKYGKRKAKFNANTLNKEAEIP